MKIRNEGQHVLYIWNGVPAMVPPQRSPDMFILLDSFAQGPVFALIAAVPESHLGKSANCSQIIKAFCRKEKPRSKFNKKDFLTV